MTIAVDLGRKATKPTNQSKGFHFFQTMSQSLPLLAAILLSAANFANSLDPDQNRHNVHPDLDPISLTLSN